MGLLPVETAKVLLSYTGPDTLIVHGGEKTPHPTLAGW
jgi:hypothetical protein